jgi:dihydroanticapsin dehydrogenase
MTTYRNVIITGASSGLGKELASKLDDGYTIITNWSLPFVDVTDKDSIEDAKEAFARGLFPGVDILINCAGVNHLSAIGDLDIADWEQVINTNARGIWMTTKALLPVMKGGTVLNIVSNASGMPMTHSLAYNASKGAAKIMTMQMARELGKTHNITVFGISPNKLAGTGMSEQIDKRVCELRGWTPEEARSYQLAALPCGEETNPETLAEFIAFLLSSKERHKYLQGCIIPYGGPMGV